jgi:hypothetical protein
MTRDSGRPFSDRGAKVAKFFDDALAFHRRGQLGERRCCIVRFSRGAAAFRQPASPGRDLFAARRSAAALQHIDAALGLNGDDADAWNNRAIALKEGSALKKRLPAAIAQ